jgi:hypothetical protein
MERPSTSPHKRKRECGICPSDALSTWFQRRQNWSWVPTTTIIPKFSPCHQVREFSFAVVQWSSARETIMLSEPQNANEVPHRPWECLDHPPFRPDHAPSNCYFCGPLQKHLKGKHFWHDKTEAEVCRCVQTLSSFLPQRNWKCVASQGCLHWSADYME